MLALVDRCCDVTGYQIRPGLVCSLCRLACLPACLQFVAERFDFEVLMPLCMPWCRVEAAVATL